MRGPSEKLRAHPGKSEVVPPSSRVDAMKFEASPDGIQVEWETREVVWLDPTVDPAEFHVAPVVLEGDTMWWRRCRTISGSSLQNPE